MKIKKNITKLKLATMMTASLWLCGCATTHNTNPQDPYENYNRHAYRFNDKLDRAILKPVATFYKKILPPPAMKSVNNFFSNLEQIPIIINDILQFNFYYAVSDVWRFAINSTVGIVGLFDVGSEIGLQKHTQDFGITLAKWGYKDSAYFIIPLFAPSTVRDMVARPINYGLFTFYPWIRPNYVAYSLLGLYYIDARAQLLDIEDVRKEASFDPYVFDRDAYLQNRKYVIENSGKKGNSKSTDANDDVYVEADGSDGNKTKK